MKPLWCSVLEPQVDECVVLRLVQEWTRRICAFQAVSLQILEFLPRGFTGSLERSLENTPAFGDNPEMALSWDAIFTPISQVRQDLSLSLDEFYEKYLESFQTAITQVNDFELQYADFLDDNDRTNIVTQKNDLGFYERFSKHMAQARRKNLILIRPIKKLALIEDLYRKFDEDIVNYINDRSFSKPTVREMISTLDGFCNLEALQTLSKTPVRGKKERNDRDNLIDSIYRHARILKSLSDHLKDLLSEVDQSFTCSGPVQAFLETYEEWSEVYDRLAIR